MKPAKKPAKSITGQFQPKRRLQKRWVFLLIVVLSVFLIKHCVWGDVMWTKISDNFMHNPDQSYGPGDYYIENDQRVEDLKLAAPKVTFKSVPRDKPNEYGDMTDEVVTEDWMDDSSERLNRRFIAYSTGPLNGEVKITFTAPAQDVAWWSAAAHGWDSGMIYIGTGWLDYHLPIPDDKPDGLQLYNPVIHRLYRSADFGQTFEPINWPVNLDCTQKMLFYSPLNGYIIGWGPAIYRTLDGLKNATRIETPPLAINPLDSRATFDLTYLDSYGDLWIVFYRKSAPYEGQSLIYRLKMGEDKPQLVVAVPVKQVVDMAYADKQLYLLTAPGRSTDIGVDVVEETKQLIRWDGQTFTTIKEFPPMIDTGRLWILPSGTIVVGAIKGRFPGNSLVYLSRDQGKSWVTEDEGIESNGLYFNEKTGERYRVNLYSLYKREIK